MLQEYWPLSMRSIVGRLRPVTWDNFNFVILNLFRANNNADALFFLKSDNSIGDILKMGYSNIVKSLLQMLRKLVIHFTFNTEIKKHVEENNFFYSNSKRSLQILELPKALLDYALLLVLTSIRQPLDLQGSTLMVRISTQMKSGTLFHSLLL